MAESYSVQAVLSVKDKNFTSTLKNAERSLSNVGTTASSSSTNVGLLGTAFAVANTVISSACSAIKNSVGKAVERVDTLNQYPTIMEQMGYSADDAEASIEKLSEGIQGLPTTLDDIVDSAQNIALMTGNLDEATDTALALNNALIASQASTDGATSATEAYTKMLSAGKVDSQHWTTLTQNMRYALQQVAGELGIASGSTQDLYDALQSGEITFDDFNTALITCSEAEGGFADMAQTSSSGIATSWSMVQTAVVRGVADMIQAWNDAAEDNGLPTVQDMLGTFRTVVDNVFGAASKVVTVFVNNLDLIVDAVVPVVAGIVSMKVIDEVTSAFGKFKDKCDKVADSLKNYDKYAEDAKTAEENHKIAVDALKDAQDKHKTAIDKCVDATKKYQDAQKNEETALKNYETAQKNANTAADNGAKSADKVTDAEKKYKDACAATEDALKEKQEAEELRKTTSEEVAEAESLVADTTNESATAMQGYTIMAVAQNAIMAALSGTMSLGTGIVKAFNAAWDANPIGLVISAVTTAISVVKTIINVLKKFGVAEDSARKKSKALKEEAEDLTESIEDNRAEMEDNTREVKNQSNAVNDLCTSITKLAGKENKTAEDTSALRTYIDLLNDSVDDLNLAYDEATDSLNLATEAMIAQAQVENTANEKAVAQENYNQALEDYRALADEIAAAEALQEETGKSQKNTIEDLTTAYEEQGEVVEQCFADMQAAQDAYTAAQQESYALQTAALQESIDQQTVAYEDLSEANQELVDQMSERYQTYVDAVLDGNNELTDSFEGTADDVASAWNDTVEHNMQVVEDWGNNMESLRGRFESLGLDPAVCDQLEAMGLDGAALVAAFVDASDEELVRFAENSEAAADTAETAMIQSLDASEVPEAVMNMATEATDSLRENLNAADWAEVADECITGLTGELESGAADANASGQVVGEQATEGVATGAETGSPSEATKRTGADIVEGLAVGMEDSSVAVAAATTLGETVVNAVDEALSAADYSGAVDSMCSTIASATESGMKQVSKAVTSAMDNATKALTDGYSQMASATTSSMSTVNSAVTSGMNTVKSTFSTTMNTIKSNVQTTLSNISSNVTSQMNTIKSTITTTLNSIKSTVTSTLNSIKSTVSSDMNSIKSTVSSGMNSIKSTVSSGMNSIKSTVTSAVNSVKSSTSSGMNSVKSTFSSGMNACVSTARSTSSSIVSAFSGLYSSLYSSGTSAMSGLQAGLNARSGSVLATARSIANSVTSTINSALKVGSPSKVLEDTGENAGEGLVIGLKNMLSKVRDVALEMADTVTNLAFGTFDAPNLAFEGGMTMSYYFDDAVVDALDDLTDALLDEDKEYTFTIPVEIDGREVAKATATFTQDELNRLEARSSRRDKFSISQ